MTPEQFRNDPALRQQLQALLSNEAFVLAQGIVLDKLLCGDADLHASKLVSVRLLSQRSGYELAFKDLHELTHVMPIPERPQPDDWGAPEAAAQLDGSDLPPTYNPT